MTNSRIDGLFDTIQKTQKQDYASAANKSGLTKGGFISAEKATNEILQRLEKQPDKRYFLNAMFNMSSVENYMIGMELIPDTFIQYIQTVSPINDTIDKNLSIKEKLTFSIVVLGLSYTAYTKMTKQHVINVENLLFAPVEELEKKWPSWSKQPQILKDTVEIWCLANKIPFEDYPLGKKHVVIEQTLAKLIKYPSEDSLSQVGLTIAQQRKLTMHGYKTINDIRSKRLSDLTRINKFSDRIATNIVSKINTYVVHAHEYDKDSIDNPVNHLGINTRGINALARMHCHTIAQLYQIPRKEVYRRGRLGELTRKQVIEKATQWAIDHSIDQKKYPFFTDI